MGEVLFRFDRTNFQDCQAAYRGALNQEYYEGDYEIEPGPTIDVHAERRPVGASTIIGVRARSRQRFRRSWAHIRHDGIDLTVLWFVRRGRLRFTGQSDSRIVGVGDFLLTRSSSPLLMECLTDDKQWNEVIHVTVPTHIIRDFIADDVPTGQIVTAPSREIATAERILFDLLQDEGATGAESSRRLLEAVLSLIGDAITERTGDRPLKQTIPGRRMEEIRRFIEIHLSDPNLSTAIVSQGCGISLRYLTTLLQMHGTSFSELVWGQRMAKAKAWLASSDAGEVPISQIAYGLGFKSVAHFSRKFKRVFQVNPSDCRAGSSGALADIHVAPEDCLQ